MYRLQIFPFEIDGTYIEVQSVHYELFKDNSVMPVVYGTVIEIEKVEEE